MPQPDDATEVNAPLPVQLIAALMYGTDSLYHEAEQRLVKRFGPVEMRGEPFDFDPFTSYYASEFGTGLRKVILSFQGLIEAEELSEIKRTTNGIEREMAAGCDSPRTVNIDPGYVNHSKLVLASTKDHSHRIYVGGGIYEEVTLNFRRDEGGFVALPWSYPDYQAPDQLDFLARVRENYRTKVAPFMKPDGTRKTPRE